MASMKRALERIKEQPLGLEGILEPAAVEQAFAECGYTWRQRTLGPARTIELFIRQMIDKNESCDYVRCMAGGEFTAGAYCAARARLPLPAFWRLCRSVWEQTRKDHELSLPLWHGHRTFHVDATGFSMPDTPQLQKTFGQPGQQAAGCGFPVAHLLLGFDARTGMLIEAVPAPLRTHDLRDVLEIDQSLKAGDILIGDKAFGSWAHLASLQAAGVHGLFSLHQRRKIARAVDRIERWPKPKRRPDWMPQEQFDALPDHLEVRVVHRVIRRRGYQPVKVALATTLVDQEKYSADDLIELGRQRWSVELNIRHLKTTMGMEVLKCKTTAGVLKELAVFLLVYNLVRAVMLKAAALQEVPVDRISFASALTWTRCTKPGAELFALLINPARPGRVEPRAIKRRPKQFPLLNRPRDQMRKSLKNTGKAA